MSFLLPKSVKDLPYAFIVACEGMGDARFLCKLLEHAGVENCGVGCPSDESAEGSGFSQLPSYLKAISQASMREGTNFRGVAVVVDADDDPMTRFTTIASALEAASFPRPSKPFGIESSRTRSAVYLIPGEGRNGTLEALFLEAIFRRAPVLEKCVNDFANCTGLIPAATENQRAKMKMSALAAAHCARNPWTSLGLIWSQENNPIPIESETFQPLADFLKAFTT